MAQTLEELDKLIGQVNKRLETSPLFYVTNDVERALGLEGLLQNFHIVCMDDSNIVDQMFESGKSVFSLEHETKELNKVFRNSVKLLSEPAVKFFIDSKDGGEKYFQTFKISSGFERIAGEYNAKVLNTSAELNMQFENKISQYQRLSPAGVKFPETIVGALKDFTFADIKAKLGEKFVVQFNRGHTGSGTHFISDENAFNTLVQQFPERIARVSKFVNGIPYTLNACIASNGVFIGGLNYQITGVEKIAQSKAATVGNDFSYRNGVDQAVLEKIIQQTNLIGSEMTNAGFKGLFGVDLIIDNGEVYIIEINARQPASIPFYTKLQLKNNQVPLSLLHIAEFLGIEDELDAKEYSLNNLQPINAGQIFLRNIEQNDVEIKAEVKTGIYEVTEKDELNFVKPAYSIDDVNESNFLLLTQKKGKLIKNGREIARIQAFQSLINKENNEDQPYDWVMNALLDVKKQILS